MPIYEGDQYTYEQLMALRKRNVCRECGQRLDVFLDGASTYAFLACKDWLRTHHDGIERESSRYEKEGMASLNIESRREILTTEYGTETTTAMEKARIPTTGALTQGQAMHILKLVYPKAPADEIVRCALLCRDFGLHPLMKEVYLIPFKDKAGRENYVTVLGISATRKMMSRQGTYSYLDNTPRVMTESEQVTIFGDVDDFNIVAITKLKTRQGEEAQGYGRWPRNSQPYGTDKGNTKANMAFIRSERNAFGRLFSDALPQGIDVIDEAYADVPKIGKVEKATGEIIEAEATELPEEVPTLAAPKVHWCDEHNCAYEVKTSKWGEFYAHKLPDGKWCNEIKKKEKPAPPKAKAEPAPKVEPAIVANDDAAEFEGLISGSQAEPSEPADNTIEALKETMQICNWSTTDIGLFCNAEKGWKIQEFKDLTPERIAELIDHIKHNAK